MFDEDYWLPAPPAAASNFRSPVLALQGQEDIPAGFLFKAFAKVSQETLEVIYGAGSNVLVSQLVVEVICPPLKPVDEDFWVNPVAPKVQSFYQRLPLGDPEEIPAGHLAVAPTVWEEYWQNPVSPVAASLYRSPVRLDPEEIPAGSLFIPAPLHVQEDYWQQLVKPVAAYIYQRLPLGDPEEIPADHLFASFLDVSQLVIEVITGYNRQVYTGWTGTSMCVN